MEKIEMILERKRKDSEKQVKERNGKRIENDVKDDGKE